MQYNLLTFIVIQEPRIQELCYYAGSQCPHLSNLSVFIYLVEMYDALVVLDFSNSLINLLYIET